MQNFKLKIYHFIFIVVLLILAVPVYMNFSHDVTVLKDKHPHKLSEKEYFPVYEFKSPPPAGWTKLKNMSPYVKWSIVLSEDWGFYQHSGIDMDQMKLALDEMAKEKRFRGASTITQQMVKNVFLNQNRTVWRKVQEIILARKVEKVLSKDRILEVYLNCIEMGPGIFGITKASWHYFKKPPSALVPREAAFIAMLLPSPKRYYSSFKAKNLTAFASSRVNAILIKLRMAKIMTRDHYEMAKLYRYSWEKYPVPPVIESEVIANELLTEDLPEEYLEKLPEALESDSSDDVREVKGSDMFREHR